MAKTTQPPKKIAKRKKIVERPSAAEGWPQARPSWLRQRRAEQTCEPRSIAAASLLAAGPKKEKKKQEKIGP